MLFVGNVADINVRSAKEAYMSKHAARFSMKSDNIHYLKFFGKSCHKKCILSITNVFLTCQPQAIEGNLS